MRTNKSNVLSKVIFSRLDGGFQFFLALLHLVVVSAGMLAVMLFLLYAFSQWH